MPRPPTPAGELLADLHADDETVRLTVRVPPRDLDRLDALARREDRSRAAEMRRALEAWLDAGGDLADAPTAPSRVTVRLPRALVARIDRRYGVSAGYRERAICGAVAMRIARDS